MPVKNYAPEMLELFRKASRKECRVELESMKAAEYLRFRLHNLRKAMRQEHHHLLSLAESVQISIERQGSKTELVARPADTAFVDALHAAGIHVEEPEEEETSPPPPHGSQAEEVLRGFLYKKSKRKKGE